MCYGTGGRRKPPCVPCAATLRMADGKHELEERLRFLGLTATDLRLLRDLRPLLERHADGLVAAFYRHLLSFEGTRSHLSDVEAKERLLRKQREYLLSLAGPTLDEAYYQDRRQIGTTHERIGLEPRWYLGAYAHYCSLLFPVICEALRQDPHRAERTVAALVKLLMLDAQIAVETYMETREEQLEFLNRELAGMTENLAREVEDTGAELLATTRRARAAEELASVGTLVAGLAHEIGTPMGVIQGHAEALEQAAADERSRWRAKTIGEQVGRISHIIQTLLNLARPRDPVREPVRLPTLVDDTLAFLREKMRRHGIEVERRFARVPEIRGDHEKIQQLLLNLFLNAIDAMPDGGTLRVGLRSGGGGVEVRVGDTGTGVAADAIERIFEPFYTTKGAGRGSGLGLVVVHGIVRDHDGEIDVSSELGRGTEFRIRFPSPDPGSREARRGRKGSRA